jgi:hypothetical protein
MKAAIRKSSPKTSAGADYRFLYGLSQDFGPTNITA